MTDSIVKSHVELDVGNEIKVADMDGEGIVCFVFDELDDEDSTSVQIVIGGSLSINRFSMIVERLGEVLTVESMELAVGFAEAITEVAERILRLAKTKANLKSTSELDERKINANDFERMLKDLFGKDGESK